MTTTENKKKQRYLGKNLSQDHFAHHKSHRLLRGRLLGATATERQRAILRYGKGISFIGSPEPGESLLGPAGPVQHFATPGSYLSPCNWILQREWPTDLCLTYIVLLYIIFDPCTTVSMRNQDGNSPRKFVSSTTSNSQQQNSTMLLHHFLVLNIHY